VTGTRHGELDLHGARRDLHGLVEAVDEEPLGLGRAVHVHVRAPAAVGDRVHEQVVEPVAGPVPTPTR